MCIVSGCFHVRESSRVSQKTQDILARIMSDVPNDIFDEGLQREIDRTQAMQDQVFAEHGFGPDGTPQQDGNLTPQQDGEDIPDWLTVKPRRLKRKKGKKGKKDSGDSPVQQAVLQAPEAQEAPPAPTTEEGSNVELVEGEPVPL